MRSRELLEGIRHQEQSLKDCPVFKEGRVVGFAQGPFADIQAIYLCERDEERRVVLPKVLNREQPVVVRLIISASKAEIYQAHL